MPTINKNDTVKTETKRVSISSKRQITIPQKFFVMLGFHTEAECMVRGNELIIRPVHTDTGGEFAEQILADLISQGYSGNELLERFKEAQKKVRPAVEAMLEEARQVATGEQQKDLQQAKTALENIQNMDKRLSYGFDPKKEFQEAKKEKYDNFG